MLHVYENEYERNFNRNTNLTLWCSKNNIHKFSSINVCFCTFTHRFCSISAYFLVASMKYKEKTSLRKFGISLSCKFSSCWNWVGSRNPWNILHKCKFSSFKHKLITKLSYLCLKISTRDYICQVCSMCLHKWYTQTPTHIQ